MRRCSLRVFIAAVLLHLICASSCGPRVYTGGESAGDGSVGRNESWARPLELPGVPNFHRVTGDLYRSAQPTTEGMRNLEEFGIKTIINLRSFHSDTDEIGEASLDCVRIPMHAWHPEEEDVIAFLEAATDEERRPVLVHCNYGADRTGFMCALYRIAVCGWSKEEALAEMVEGGFGFHMIWRNLIDYIEKMDIDFERSKK